MRDNFAASLTSVLQHEGGYSNDPLDRGGATNRGITQSVYDDWRRAHGQEPRSVRGIDINEVEAIYKKRYWDAVSGDQLPSGLDYCIFDFAVNSGPARAARFLQRILGVTEDGKIGPQTIAAAKAADVGKVIADVSAARVAFLQTLPTYQRFGRGWSARVADVRVDAGLMA